MKIEELLKNEELLETLDRAESEEEFRAILAANGAAEEDVNAFIEHLGAMAAELSEEDLENVAGGGNPLLQRYLFKWVYRFKHKRWFVKTSYDEDTRTITATNRFGTPVSETELY